MARGRLSVGVIQIVLELRIRPFLNKQLRHGKMAVLRCHVQRGYALAVSEAAESGFLVHHRPMIDQPLGRIDSIAHRGPDERGAAIWIGVEARTRPDEPVEHLRTATLAGPDQRLIQDFLRTG